MTERLPYVQQNRTVASGAGHNAQEWRYLTGDLVAVAGVTSATACKVAAPGGMNVTVAAGGAVIPDAASPAGGAYHAYNDGTVTLPIDPSHATLNRVDRVVYQVLDTAFGDAEDRARIAVVKGTPAASAQPPALPRAAISLCTVGVAAAQSAVAAGNIGDQRVATGGWLTPRGVIFRSQVTSQVVSTNATGAVFFDVSVPTVIGRRYAICYSGVHTFSQASGGGDIKLTVDAVASGVMWQGMAVVAQNSFAVLARRPTFIATKTATPMTLKLSLTLGTGSMTIDPAWGPILLEIVDEGGTLL